MTRIFVLILAMMGLTFGVSANETNGPPGQSAEHRAKVETNRCANAGNGNGSEETTLQGSCGSFPLNEEDSNRDLDPGNSGAHNANND